MIAQCGIENEHKGFVFDGRGLPFLFVHHDWQTVDLVIVQLMTMLMMIIVIMLFLLTAEGERAQLRSRGHSFNSIISIIAAAAATTGTCSKSWRIDGHFVIRIIIIIIVVRVFVAYEC